MKQIPTKLEKPLGLHQRYVIKKIAPHPQAGQEIPVEGGLYEKRGRGNYPDFEIIDTDPECRILRHAFRRKRQRP